MFSCCHMFSYAAVCHAGLRLFVPLPAHQAGPSNHIAKWHPVGSQPGHSLPSPSAEQNVTFPPFEEARTWSKCKMLQVLTRHIGGIFMMCVLTMQAIEYHIMLRQAQLPPTVQAGRHPRPAPGERGGVGGRCSTSALTH